MPRRWNGFTEMSTDNSEKMRTVLTKMTENQKCLDIGITAMT